MEGIGWGEPGYQRGWGEHQGEITKHPCCRLRDSVAGIHMTPRYEGGATQDTCQIQTSRAYLKEKTVKADTLKRGGNAVGGSYAERTDV